MGSFTIRVLTEKVNLAGKAYFEFEIRAAGCGIECLSESQKLSLRVPQDKLEAFSQTLPSKTGLTTEIPVGPSELLKVALEADVHSHR